VPTQKNLVYQKYLKITEKAHSAITHLNITEPSFTEPKIIHEGNTDEDENEKHSNLEMIPHEDLLSEISKLNENTAIENSYEEQRNPNDNGASHLYHKEYFGKKVNKPIFNPTESLEYEV